jgi:hypothetical protein
MKKSTVTYPDGLKYTGELKGDKRHGKGTLIFPNDGPKYIGEFKDNKMHGQGTITSWSRYYNIS